MRWVICLLTILLGGCHGISLLEREASEASAPIMSLWERYQQCRAATDHTELFLIIEQFDHVGSGGTTPPFWMGAWGDYVKSQPIRTAVDPQALGAACTLRVAGLMVKAQHLTEGRALYQHVVARYSSRDLAYYVDQAKEALAAIQASAPAVVALHPHPASSH